MFIYLTLKTQVVLSITKKVIILKKYLDYVDFLQKLAVEPHKRLGINK